MSKNTSRQHNRIDIIRKAAGIIILAAGLLLIGASLLLNYLQYSTSSRAVKEFKEDLTINEAVTVTESGANVTVLDAQKPSFEEKELSTPKFTKETPASTNDALYVLRIPRIDSENLVREGVGKAVLRDALGHDPRTSYIGEGGNCVIAGHRNYSFGKFFNRLNEVEIGDEIYVDAPEGTYNYRVTEVKVVTPDQVEILNNTEDEQITLYTCTPIYIATHRLVIIAKRE